MWQTVVIFVVLALVLAYVARHYARALRSGASPCSGCTGCSAGEPGRAPDVKEASCDSDPGRTGCRECPGGPETSARMQTLRSGNHLPLRPPFKS